MIRGFLLVALLLALHIPGASAQPSGCPFNTSSCVSKSTGSTTARSMSARGADVVNVRDYGAKCDTTTDDTAAIAAAAAAIPSAGGVLYIPAGTCLVKATTSLKSGTTVKGDGWGSIILTDSTFVPGLGSLDNAIFVNVNYSASVLTDANITIQDIQLDYGTFGPVSVPNSKKMVALHRVRDAVIKNVLFQTRGGGDAVAGLGVYNMLVSDNSAYGFTNCAYDFWTAPTNVRVTGNYAETASSAQMVNFNPENTTGSSAGNVASGFVLSNNHFVTSAGSATPILLEPLGSGTTVRDVVVSGNVLDNVTLYMRGDTAHVVVTGNTFNKSRGTPANLVLQTQNSGTPDDITITSNLFNDPDTSVGNLGVIVANGATTHALIAHNQITGTQYSGAVGIYTATAPATVVGNYVSTGVNNTTSSAQNYGKFGLAGTTSGLVKINPQPVAGTYTFELPITAGSSGQMLLSGGGAGTAMTWSTPVLQTVANSLTATGTGQSDALAITAGTSVFTTVASGTGAVLLSTNLYVQRIVNFGANALLVYPPSGASIGSHSSNVAFSLAALSVATCVYSNSIHWYCTTAALS